MGGRIIVATDIVLTKSGRDENSILEGTLVAGNIATIAKGPAEYIDFLLAKIFQKLQNDMHTNYFDFQEGALSLSFWKQAKELDVELDI